MPQDWNDFYKSNKALGASELSAASKATAEVANYTQTVVVTTANDAPLLKQDLHKASTNPILHNNR